MDKLTNMRAFTKVVAHGSFTEAAREMGLSRSAVSKYVIDLEAELGVQLLSRTTQSVSSTDAGQRYYERCLAIIAEIEDAELDLSDCHASPRGILRVNAPMSFGTLHLGRAIGDFMVQYPDLQVQLILSDQQLDMVQEGFDVTVRITDAPPFNLIGRKIVAAPRMLCASPHYLEQAGVPAHPDDLLRHKCLHYGYLASGAQWKLKGEDGEHGISVPWRLCSNNGEILRDAALAHQGIALLPAFIIREQLREARLLPVLADYKSPEMSIYALYAPTRHVPIKLRVFIDFLVARFSGPAGW